jgi:hypothetical protein
VEEEKNCKWKQRELHGTQPNKLDLYLKLWGETEGCVMGYKYKNLLKALC